MKCPHCGEDFYLHLNLPEDARIVRIEGDKTVTFQVFSAGHMISDWSEPRYGAAASLVEFNADGTVKGVRPALMNFWTPGPAESPLEAEARTKAAQRAADNRNR